MPSRDRLLILVVFVLAPSIYVGTVAGWENAIWYIVLCGFMFWVGFGLWDMFGTVYRWLNRTPDVTVRIYDHEEDGYGEIIDAEVVEDKYKRRWWEV